MNKLTLEDLKRVFSSTRPDHPGRKGSQTFTRGAGTLPKDGLSPRERVKKNG